MKASLHPGFGFTSGPVLVLGLGLGGGVLWWQRWYSRLYHYWIGSDAVTSISNIVVVSVAVRGDIIMIAIVVG